MAEAGGEVRNEGPYGRILGDAIEFHLWLLGLFLLWWLCSGCP